MSNGLLCCLHGVCCPPLERVKAWTRKFSSWIAEMPNNVRGAIANHLAEGAIASYLAERLLAEHDPAPLGTAAAVVANWGKSDAELGAAIRILYQATMDEAVAHGHGHETHGHETHNE